MLLFKCATYVQLMNAIQIKRSLYPYVQADLILSQITDFTSIVEKIRSCGVFRKVYEIEESLLSNEEFKKKSDIERNELSVHPEFIFDKYGFDGEYTEFFIGVPYPNDILLYYYLVNIGNKIKVNFYEEAQTTYLRNFHEKVAQSGAVNSRYGQKDFLRNKGACFLYEPDLYFGIGYKNMLRKIPKITKDDETIRIYNSIFGLNEMPDEKYIFFEENFIGDNNITSDIDCLDELADYIGKENIIVKMHPRSPVNRFSHRGYKIFPESCFPMEILLLNSDASDKVFVTISSGSGVSASVMFDDAVYSINLFRHMVIGSNFQVREKNFMSYFKKLMQTINIVEPRIFAPYNSEELKEIIKYIEGGLINE